MRSALELLLLLGGEGVLVFCFRIGGVRIGSSAYGVGGGLAAASCFFLVFPIIINKKMCFDCQPVFPPSPKAERLNKAMYVILICEVVLAILRFALAWDFFGGLIECFMCLILYCGIKQMQYCSMLMYIIICLLFWVFAFVSIGTVI